SQTIYNNWASLIVSKNKVAEESKQYIEVTAISQDFIFPSSYLTQSSPIKYTNYINAWFTDGKQMVEKHRLTNQLTEKFTPAEIIRHHTFTPLLDNIALLYGKKGITNNKDLTSDRTILYIRTFYADRNESQASILDMLFDKDTFHCFHRASYMGHNQDSWGKEYAFDAWSFIRMNKNINATFKAKDVLDAENIINVKANDGSFVMELHPYEIIVNDPKHNAVHRIIVPQGLNNPDLDTYNRATVWKKKNS
ncbi:MAG: hypothetical protein JHC93_05095, partial [Parachlamydiales bacterium]|nr:hypothetical protein [Parachlamydiales bacterium]